MGAPQIIVIVLSSLSIGLEIDKHGTEKVTKHNAWTAIVGQAILLGLLYWGGFFDG